MSRVASIVVLVIVALAFGVAVAIVSREGRRPLWLTGGIVTALLLALGITAWSAQGVRETPLHTYILLATVPTFAGATALALLPEGRFGLSARVAVAAGTWLVVASIALLSAFYP